jgi:hypothetical protein
MPKYMGLTLSDICNSDDSQANGNVGGDGGNDDSGSGYDDEDDSEDWAL